MARNEQLRQQRTLRNWRQQDVADKLGVSVLTIQRWERGNQQPSAYYRTKLCHLFGLTSLELGLVEGNVILASSKEEEEISAPVPDEPLALWTVPYVRNPHFTGRDELLAQLEHQFASDSTEHITSPRRVAITQSQVIKGLGGIGKTQLAVEYAYRANDLERYTHTLWIAAATSEALMSSFVALAALLPDEALQRENDQHKLMLGVKRWLEQCHEPWLLIVDNADDLTMVQPYLPVQGKGHVLLTTRANAVGTFGAWMEVDIMDFIEGTQLLLRRAQRFEEASEDEINEAISIVMALGQFPLALDQAGAYIEETGCRIGDYLELYQQHQSSLLARRGRQMTGYPDSVATTWSLSFQHVQAVNPSAAELLQLCALLSPDAIPEELLVQGSAHWPAALHHATEDRFSFNQALESLLAFSLIKRQTSEHVLSIHRLVQAVQREHMSKEEQRQWAKRLVLALHVVFPPDSNEAFTWPQCARYLEQAQGADLLIKEHRLLLPEAAEVLERTGTYLRARALYALAEPLYQQALTIWEQMEESGKRARTLNHMALLSYWQDKSAQAETLYQQSLALGEQFLGPQHLDVAESLNGLAGLYRMQGKYTQAEPLYLRALGIREQQLGAEHVLVAESLGGLATLYRRQGKYSEAKALHTRTLHIREQQLGPYHVLVAESLHDMSILFSYLQGEQAECEALSWRALRIWEQQLGTDHLMVTYPLLNLAVLYRKQERYSEAEPLYLRALRVSEQQFGATHRNMIHPLTGLAQLYRQQGNYVEAEPLYLQALHIGDEQWGPQHPVLAFTLDGLAALYAEQGNYSDAEQLYQRALKIREQQLGPQHSDVALSLNGLANAYFKQGRYEEAELFYQRALQILGQDSSSKDADTAEVLFHVARFRQAQGQLQEATCLYQRALTLREQVFGADHAITKRTRESLQRVTQVQESMEKS